MECPTCKQKHHVRLFGLVKCGECYGRVAQQSSLGESESLRQDDTRASVPSMQQGTNRWGLDYRSHSAPQGGRA
jgi:hypothetical protein